MKKKVIYISGSISNLSISEVEQKFEKAENRLRTKYPEAEIINPLKLNHSENIHYLDFMYTDLMSLYGATHIYYCDFFFSCGMKIESIIAKQLNIKRIWLI